MVTVTFNLDSATSKGKFVIFGEILAKACLIWEFWICLYVVVGIEFLSSIKTVRKLYQCFRPPATEERATQTDLGDAASQTQQG